MKREGKKKPGNDDSFEGNSDFSERNFKAKQQNENSQAEDQLEDERKIFKSHAWWLPLFIASLQTLTAGLRCG